VIIEDLMGELLVERLASGGLGTGRIAWLTTRRILISLCCFSFSIFGGALASVIGVRRFVSMITIEIGSSERLATVPYPYSPRVETFFALRRDIDIVQVLYNIKLFRGSGVSGVWRKKSLVAYADTCTGTGWAKCPPGLVQGRLTYLFTGPRVPGLPLLFEIWAPGEYGKARYAKSPDFRNS
jgi:hypothetical protein